MKNKIESDIMIENLVQLFQKDDRSSDWRDYLEYLFMEGNLENEDLSYTFSIHEKEIVCDGPDERIEMLNKFIDSIGSIGIHVIPGHSGNSECLIEYIDNLIRLEPSLSPFILVEHSLKEHLAFLQTGKFDIGWDLHTFPGDRMTSNCKIAEYLQFEAKRFGFLISEISIENRKMSLIYSGDYSEGDIHSTSNEFSANPNIADIISILEESKPSLGSHLEGFKLPMAENASDIRLLSDVNDFGFHIVWDKSGNTQPDYCFTIGLEYSYDHPEIMLTGLPFSTAKRIIDDLGSEIRKGQKFIDENQCINISSKKFMVKKMRPSNYRHYLGYFLWFYRSLKPRPVVMQLFWPDESDKFPWDDGYSEKLLKSQPLLFEKLSS